MNTEYIETIKDEDQEEIEVHDRRELNPIFIHSILDDYGLTSDEFRLFCHLARRAADGKVWAGVHSMSVKCRQNKDTIRKGLRSLIEYRIISEQRRWRKSTIYTLNPVSMWLPPKKGPWNVPFLSKPERGVSKPNSQILETPRLVDGNRQVGQEGNPSEGNPSEEVPTLFISLPNSDSQDQEADRVAVLVEKKAPVASPAPADELLPSIPVFVTEVKIDEFLKSEQGREFTKAEAMEARGQLDSTRDLKSGWWKKKNGQIITDWAGYLAQWLSRARIIAGEHGPAPGVVGTREQRASYFMMANQLKRLEEEALTLEAHPSRLFGEDDHLTDKDRREWAESRKKIRTLESKMAACCGI